MDCKQVNFFALKFLNRSFNEAVVEVEISNLKQQSTESRSLLQKTTEMLNFVSTNGPHPLVSMNVADSFIDLHFGKEKGISQWICQSFMCPSLSMPISDRLDSFQIL